MSPPRLSAVDFCKIGVMADSASYLCYACQACQALSCCDCAVCLLSQVQHWSRLSGRMRGADCGLSANLLSAAPRFVRRSGPLGSFH